MYFINPFKGLRPNKNFVSSVVIPSTDHLSEELVHNHKKNNEWSFLNVLNPNEQNLNSENDKYQASKKQFELMKQNSILSKDDTNCYYIYKISTNNHSQIGIIGTVKISSYDDLHIRGHEEIFIERAQERSDQMLNLNAQIGPIYVIHPENELINSIINQQIINNPEYSFKSLDGCLHTFWKINSFNTIKNIGEVFTGINRVYIADGHHRMEAMQKLSNFKKHQNPNHTGNEAYNYTMVAAFPQSQARILDYNRLIKDLYGFSSENFIKEVKKKFIVKKNKEQFKPNIEKTFGMYIDKSWYSIEFKFTPDENLFHINNLDINMLHYYLLEPILGIRDSRYDKRIDFLAGFKGLNSIEKKVDSGEYAVGFSLFPTQIEDVITFADKKINMPPKSTWFDPKPLDGLVLYDFE
ncbi:MAG: hypothetical protein CMI95_02595 [Pelagibacteraceae bacterium]|nr:hypothetical protein [Pelagibacteraceae bacterium]|tara:strand:- start:43455 stop:44684 length:1230 start_codon:yes stop_codon:yes gene_type:complete